MTFVNFWTLTMLTVSSYSCQAPAYFTVLISLSFFILIIFMRFIVILYRNKHHGEQVVTKATIKLFWLYFIIGLSDSKAHAFGFLCHNAVFWLCKFI